jgi:hypothetical protein
MILLGTICLSRVASIADDAEVLGLVAASVGQGHDVV